MSILEIIILSIASLITLILVVATLFFFKLAIVRQPREQKDFLVDNPDLAAGKPADVPIVATPWIERQPLEDLEMKSYDGLLLHAYYLPARVPTHKTVILAHGYSGRAKDDPALLAQMYYEELGFNLLLPDNRAHGASEGNYIGLGWHDRLDYVKWINYALQRSGPEAQIVLHGISMGGATVLMTGGEPLPAQVKGIISDCAYTSALDILAYQLKRTYKLPPFPFMPLTSLVCKLRAGYFFSEASALKQVSKTNLPILFIHGQEDAFVPTEMVYRLYEKSNAYKELLVVPGAGHGLAYPTDRSGYTQKVKSFNEKIFM